MLMLCEKPDSSASLKGVSCLVGEGRRRSSLYCNTILRCAIRKFEKILPYTGLSETTITCYIHCYKRVHAFDKCLTKESNYAPFSNCLKRGPLKSGVWKPKSHTCIQKSNAPSPPIKTLCIRWRQRRPYA